MKKLKVGTQFKKDSAGKPDDQYQTWLNLAVKLDPYKTVSVRSATGILDFLGDIGGIQIVLETLFAGLFCGDIQERSAYARGSLGFG